MLLLGSLLASLGGCRQSEAPSARVELLEYLPVARVVWSKRGQDARSQIVVGDGFFSQPQGSTLTYYFLLPERAHLRGRAVLRDGTAEPGSDVAARVRVALLDGSGTARTLLEIEASEPGDAGGFDLDADLEEWGGRMAGIRLEMLGKRRARGPRIEWQDLRIEAVADPPLPEAAVRRDRYNVLLILFDTLRADRTEP